MKKIVAAAFFLASTSAFATSTYDIEIDLADDTYLAVGEVDATINNARQGRMTAQADRAGFVKNSFDFTVSANVIAGVIEQSANSRFGVVAGSNKGYNVFTGSSVGGSISQCGDQVTKDTEDLGASLVVTATLDLDEPNGCAR